MKKESGFTLLEVIIAMVLLAVVMIGMATIPLSSRRFRAIAQTRVTAMNYGEKILEEYRNTPFNSIISQGETVIPANTIGNSSDQKNVIASYSYRVQVENLDINSVSGTLGTTVDNSDPDVRRVTVMVSYTGENTGMIQLSAIIRQ